MMEQQDKELLSAISDLLDEHGSFKEALELDHEQVMGLALYVGQLLEAGNTEDAKRLSEGLVVLEPENAYLHTCSGVVYKALGESQSAIESFERALDLEPENVASNTYLGELCLEAKEIDRAMPHLRRAVELDPQSEDPWANRARALLAATGWVADAVREQGPGAVEHLSETGVDP